MVRGVPWGGSQTSANLRLEKLLLLLLFGLAAWLAPLALLPLFLVFGAHRNRETRREVGLRIDQAKGGMVAFRRGF